MAGTLKTIIGVIFIALFAGKMLSRGPAIASKLAVAQPAMPTASAGLRPRPTMAEPLGYGSITLRADPRGHYFADVDIDGVRTAVMVDTGATLVALSYEDAERLGRAPAPSDFTWVAHTANGESRNAPITLHEIRLGSLVAHDVQGVVMPRGVAGRALLGMSFLKQFRFAAEDGALTLRP